MDARPFSLLVKPVGAACNIACDYCFYLCKQDVSGGGGRMPEETLEKILESYFALPFPSHDVAFQGGEPLLAGLDFFETASEIAHRPAWRGKRISFSVQTNALEVTDAMAEFFAREKWLLGVSVDGDAALHDAHRRRRDGRGTFEDVMRGISILDAHGCEYNVLALVNEDTVKHPERVYRFLRDSTRTAFLQFTQCVEQVPAGEWDEYLCRIAGVWRNDGDVGRVFVRNIEAALSHIAGLGAHDCIYAPACDGYVVVEKNGDAYPCDFHVQESTLLGNAVSDGWENIASNPVREKFAAAKCPRHSTRNPAVRFEEKLRREILPFLRTGFTGGFNRTGGA